MRRPSCLPQFCLAEPQVHMAQLLSGFRSNTATVTDLCPICLSLHHCLFRTFTLILAQLFQTVSLNFSCIAACISCITSSLLTLAYPPGSLRGVGRKRGSETPAKFYHFARLCRHIPTVGGLSFIGFTPCPRPRVRGQAPHSLLRVGFLPGSFHGEVAALTRKSSKSKIDFCSALRAQPKQKRMESELSTVIDGTCRPIFACVLLLLY